MNGWSRGGAITAGLARQSQSLIVCGQPGNCWAPGWVTSTNRGQHSKVTSRVDFLKRIRPQPSAQPGLPIWAVRVAGVGGDGLGWVGGTWCVGHGSLVAWVRGGGWFKLKLGGGFWLVEDGWRAVDDGTWGG